MEASGISWIKTGISSSGGFLNHLVQEFLKLIIMFHLEVKMYFWATYIYISHNPIGITAANAIEKGADAALTQT